MNEKKITKLHILILASFVILNILNTYFQTTLLLNRYISPVERSLRGELTAFFGNFSFLLFVIIITYAIFKKDKNRFKTLIIVTGILNVFIFLMNIFTMFYGTTFTLHSFQIFKNPSEGVSDGLFSESLLQLFTYYRILIFVPLFTLLTLYFIYKKSTKGNIIKTKINLNQYIIASLSFVIILIGSIFSYSFMTLKTNNNVNAIEGTRGIQNFGLYPYYVGEFIGLHFHETSKESMKIENDQELFDAFDFYNKNKSEYLNFIDNQSYSNELILKDSLLETNNYLNLNEDDSLTGIFKDKNLVLVHLESLNYFLFEVLDIKSEFTFLNELFKESFVFENYYTSVGMGVSSDAEFSVLTGLYPNGYTTFYRDYEKGNFEIDSLATLFGKNEYRTKVYHGDHKDFYNRENAYKDLLGFSEPYYSIDEFVKRDNFKTYKEYLKAREKGIDYHGLKITSPWPSEFEMFDAMYEDMETFNGDKSFVLPMYLTPHTPFLFNPTKNSLEHIKNYSKLKSLTKRYIENASYVDELTKSLLFDYGTGESRIDENSVYVFYSDHGSSIKNNDLSLLFDRELNTLEERRILQQAIAFIYAPSSEIDPKTKLNKGLMTGVQSHVRTHTDLYRTIGDLFGLFNEDDFYFGTHGLSMEPGYAIDNRVQDIIFDNLDDLNNPYITSLRNSKKIFPYLDYSKYNYIFNAIERFKNLNDLMLIDDTVYKNLKKQYKKLKDWYLFTNIIKRVIIIHTLIRTSSY